MPGGSRRGTSRCGVWRRHPGSPILFLVAASLALAVFAASQAMVSSLRTTVEAKAKVFVGSDVGAADRSGYGDPCRPGVPCHHRHPVAPGGSVRRHRPAVRPDRDRPGHVRGRRVLERAVLRSIRPRADGPAQRRVRRPTPGRDGQRHEAGARPRSRSSSRSSRSTSSRRPRAFPGRPRTDRCSWFPRSDCATRSPGLHRSAARGRGDQGDVDPRAGRRSARRRRRTRASSPT